MVQLSDRPKRKQSKADTATHQPNVSKFSRSPISPFAMRSPLVQAKLTVNQPGDQYEQEADAVASAVTSTPAPLPQPDQNRAASLQRMATDEETVQRIAAEETCTACQQNVLQRVAIAEKEETIQRQGEKEEETVQRQPEEEQTIQRKGVGQPKVSNSTTATIRSPGAGKPLPNHVRHRIEPHVGANLSGVRVHTDTKAQKAASNLNARAFTHGNHIFLNRSESSHNLGLMAHESTHVVQQGSAPIQRQPMPDKEQTVQKKPISSSSKPPEVQRFIPDFILEELADYARYIPGYTLFTVIIGYDPLRGEDVDRNATNLLEGLMGLTGPFGTLIFDALQEYGVIDAAFSWVSDELDRLDLSLSRIERTVDEAWDDVELIEGFDYNLDVVKRHFQALYDDVIEFAESLVDRVIELIKEALIDFAEPLLAENQAWALVKKILKYDPLRDEPVDATTVEILEDFLMLIGKEQELEQMKERGTLQETADWLDTQFATFTGLTEELRSLITGVWDAIQPENLGDIATNLENLATQAGSFLQQAWDFALTVALKVLELIKNALLAWLSTFAADIPGYHLMTVILEKDPFTQEEVPRNATNLIRGFMGLIPGGEQQFQQMQETGVIPQAAQRIEGLMTELGISWPFVQQLFLDVWNAFTIEDLLSPIDAFIRVLDQFQEPLGRLFTFVIEVIKVALELILALMNFPSELIASIISNALQALDDIQRDPVGFLINLLQTAKLGFQKFFDNILEHLLGGLTDWLFSAVREAGVEPPTEFTFEAILGFVLDVLGLTMDHMWELLGQHIGEERAAQLRETIDRVVEIAGEAWGFIQDVQERGIVAVWEYIESQLTNLWDVVLEQVQSYVMERVVMVGMRWLLSLLDATGITPVINSFIAFFNAIQSAIQYLREMLEVVNDFVSTVASIAAGDIEPGAVRMEQGLANSVPIVIGFIANQLGLGNIGDRLGQIIEGVREIVDSALNWLIEQAIKLGKSILQGIKGGIESIFEWWKLKKTVKRKNGQSLTVAIQGGEDNPQLTIAASPPKIYVAYFEQLKSDNPKLDFTAALATAQTVDERTQALKDRRRRYGTTPISDWLPEDQTQHTKDGNKVREELNNLADQLSALEDSGLVTQDAPASVVELSNGLTSDGYAASSMTASILSWRKGNTTGADSDAAPANESMDILLKRKAGGQSLYVRGHLLNARLHGPASWDNLTPITRDANKEHTSKIEFKLRQKILESEDRQVWYYEVTPKYDGEQSNPKQQMETMNTSIGSREKTKEEENKLRLWDKETGLATELDCKAYRLQRNLKTDQWEKWQGQGKEELNATIPNIVPQDPTALQTLTLRILINLNPKDADVRALRHIKGMGEKTALEFIQSIRPEIQDKGQDWWNFDKIKKLLEGISKGLSTFKNVGWTSTEPTIDVFRDEVNFQKLQLRGGASSIRGQFRRTVEINLSTPTQWEDITIEYVPN
jgi:phage-related protein